MNKHILLVSLLALTGMSASLSANSLTDMFKGQDKKLIEAINKTYPAAFRQSKFLYQLVVATDWNKTLADVQKYLKDKKATQLLVPFDTIKKTSDNLVGLNRLINKEYGSFIANNKNADLTGIANDLNRQKNELTMAMTSMSTGPAQTADKDAKAVLTTIIGLLNGTINDTLREIDKIR